jgi:hypothetical protein
MRDLVNKKKTEEHYSKQDYPDLKSNVRQKYSHHCDHYNLQKDDNLKVYK